MQFIDRPFDGALHQLVEYSYYIREGLVDPGIGAVQLIVADNTLRILRSPRVGEQILQANAAPRLAICELNRGHQINIGLDNKGVSLSVVKRYLLGNADMKGRLKPGIEERARDRVMHAEFDFRRVVSGVEAEEGIESEWKESREPWLEVFTSNTPRPYHNLLHYRIGLVKRPVEGRDILGLRIFRAFIEGVDELTWEVKEKLGSPRNEETLIFRDAIKDLVANPYFLTLR